MQSTVHEDRRAFMTISGYILLRMRHLSDQSCGENQKEHFMFQKLFPPLSCAIYVIMWKHTVQLDRPQMKI